MPNLTYEGPEDPNDISTHIEIRVPTKKGEPDEIVTLHKGVETEVSDAIAKAAAKVEGHKVSTKAASGGSNS